MKNGPVILLTLLVLALSVVAVRMTLRVRELEQRDAIPQMVPAAERAASAKATVSGGGGKTSSAEMSGTQALSLSTTQMVQNPVLEKDVCEEIDCLISRKQYEQALARVEELFAKEWPAAVRERLALYKGNLLFALGKLDDAYAVYRDLLIQGKRDDVRSWATVKLYALAKNLGRVDETIVEFHTLYNNKSSDSRMGLILADLYAYEGAAEKEAGIRETLLNDRAHLEENGQKLIVAYKKSHAFENAAEAAQLLAKNDVEHAAYYYLQQAQLLTQAKNPSAAVTACENVVNSTGADAQTLLRCGYVFEQLGRPEQAMVAFSKGASTATEQHRQERCRVEELRLKKQQSSLSSDDLVIIRTLVQSAKAQGVRALAKSLLNGDK